MKNRQTNRHSQNKNPRNPSTFPASCLEPPRDCALNPGPENIGGDFGAFIRKCSHQWALVLLTIVLAATGCRSCKSQQQAIKSSNLFQRKQIDFDSAFQRQTSESFQAQTQYVEIRDILNNPESTIQAQIFALKRFPEAMKAHVHVVSNGGVHCVYPNAEPLKILLRQYSRAKRGPDKEIPDPKWKNIGNEIVRLLNKLGPADPDYPRCSLWALNEYSGKLRPISEDETKYASKSKAEFEILKGRELELKTEAKLAEQRWVRTRDESPKGEKTIFDLRHLAPDDFVGFNAPYLFVNWRDMVILFPDGANFGEANLYGAKFFGCSMKKASLISCDLRNADFTGADTTAAQFNESRMEGTILPPPTGH